MRERPVRFSDSTGLRWCGIAEDPFWPSEKNSSASSTSVRCKCRISVARRSTDDAITPRVAKYIAWRSRGITWVEIGSGVSPIALATCASTRGSICAKVPTAAGDRAGRDFLAGGDEPLAGAGELRIGVSEFQPERDRFGMNAVGAADGRRHLVLEGALLQCGENLVDVGDQKIGSAGQLHVEAGIEHVGGGHALMHEARLGADDFRQMGQEGDDVVLGLALDFVDALDVEGGVPGLGPDRLRGRFRNDAEFRQRIRRMRLDLEPYLEIASAPPRSRPFPDGL